uniref:DNA-directed RNA polymerase subunit n=9 Tax=Triticeae TaxID=147389 RepID=F2DI00_HORVV|nr:predicted protein [Hordeum vulgare subsp. vulgare]
MPRSFGGCTRCCVVMADLALEGQIGHHGHPSISQRSRLGERTLSPPHPPPPADEEEEEEMFFHIVLERNMQLHPRHFGPHLRDKLVAKLMKDVEGTCSGRHGFVVAITGVEDIGKGLIREGTGFVTFPVKYQCVVFRPFKGEILEAVVTMVNKMGFFAEAGPVQIFVSNHLIPDDMEFQSGDVPNYTTSDGSVKIQKESEVRLKIIGTRVDATEIFCIGTIKDDFLGVISDPGGAL